MPETTKKTDAVNWFACDNDIANCDRANHMTRKLPYLSFREAVYHWVALLGLTKRKCPDGLIATLSDRQIEEGSYWTKYVPDHPGEFAEYVKQYVIDDDGRVWQWGKYQSMTNAQRQAKHRAKLKTLHTTTHENTHTTQQDNTTHDNTDNTTQYNTGCVTGVTSRYVTASNGRNGASPPGVTDVTSPDTAARRKAAWDKRQEIQRKIDQLKQDEFDGVISRIDVLNVYNGKK